MWIFNDQLDFEKKIKGDGLFRFGEYLVKLWGMESCKWIKI